MNEREMAEQVRQVQGMNVKLTLAFIAGAIAGVWIGLQYIVPAMDPVPGFLTTCVVAIVGGVIAQRLLLNVMAR